MATNFTNRGRTWELANSWWILLTFLPFGMTSFISFLYIGSKVKNKRWRMYGFAYLGAFILAMIISSTGVGAVIAVTLWITTIVHAYKIRSVYLIQLDVMKANQPAIDHEKLSKLRQEAEEKFRVEEKTKTQPPQVKPKAHEEKQPDQPQVTSVKNSSPVVEEKQVEKIDMNTATEAQIAAIPAIGLILAKKVIMKRKELGGFQSFEQFAQVIGLKEHTLDKIRLLVEFSQTGNAQIQNQSGRVIDF